MLFVLIQSRGCYIPIKVVQFVVSFHQIWYVAWPTSAGQCAWLNNPHHHKHSYAHYLK